MKHKNGVDIQRKVTNLNVLITFVRLDLSKKNINIFKLILQGFLWKFDYESQINNFLLKKICDEFGMMCTTRGCNFYYLIVIVLENHIYDATF